MCLCILFISEVMLQLHLFFHTAEFSQNTKPAWFIVDTGLFYRPLASHSSGQTWILKDRLRWPQRFPLTSLPTLGSAQRHPTATWRRWTSHGEDWRTSRWSMEAAPWLKTHQWSLITQASTSGVRVMLQCQMMWRCSLRTRLHSKRPSDAHVEVYPVLIRHWYTHINILTHW